MLATNPLPHPKQNETKQNRDIENASFDCAKDRHIFPWLDVNVRFGFIKYATEDDDPRDWEDVANRLNVTKGTHPSKFVDAKK